MGDKRHIKSPAYIQYDSYSLQFSGDAYCGALVEAECYGLKKEDLCGMWARCGRGRRGPVVLSVNKTVSNVYAGLLGHG